MYVRGNQFLTGEILRFIIVGIINTLNYYLLYLFFTVILSFYYMGSHILAFVLSMIGSFYLNTYFTYRTKPSLKKFFQFPFTYVVNMSVTSLALFILVDLLHMDHIVSPILSTVLAIPFTFFVSRKILKD